MDLSGGENTADGSSVTVDVFCWGSDTHGQHGHGSLRASGGSSSDRVGVNTDAPVSAADAAIHIVHNRQVAGGSSTAVNVTVNADGAFFDTPAARQRLGETVSKAVVDALQRSSRRRIA